MEQLKLTQRFKNSLNDFTQRLRDIYKDGLISIILYGSAASGEFAGKFSNINLAVVLDNTSLNNLNKISKIINKNEFRIFNPLFFTEDYIRNSVDVFPIEFLDMKENYFILYGKDVLRDLRVDIRNLRFQCEQELKAKLMNIKRFYLRNKNKSALENLLFRSFTSSLHILRNLLRLKGKTPSYLKEDVLKDIAQEFQIDKTSFNKILEAKLKKQRLTYRKLEDLFFSFVTELEKIVNCIGN